MLSRPSHIVKAIALVILVAGLTGCHSSKKTVTDNGRYNKNVTVTKGSRKDSKKTTLPPSVSRQVAKDLVSEARTWIGTPYRYGGQDKKGTDCSGFVMQVYKAVTGISLPRNSAQQCEFCATLDKDDLCVGDLIFFSSNASSSKIAHVGLYIGDGRMIHASSSRGVMESSIHSNYYLRHYRACGRVPVGDAFPATEKPVQVSVSATPVPAVRDNHPLDIEPESPVPDFEVVLPAVSADKPAPPAPSVPPTTGANNDSPENIVKNAFKAGSKARR